MSVQIEIDRIITAIGTPLPRCITPLPSLWGCMWRQHVSLDDNTSKIADILAKAWGNTQKALKISIREKHKKLILLN